MTESSQPQESAEDRDEAAAPATAAAGAGQAFGDLDRRPVAEHVAIFEAEHTRLQDELSTIDQL